jgi:hypothetical protein
VIGREWRRLHVEVTGGTDLTGPPVSTSAIRLRATEVTVNLGGPPQTRARTSTAES